MIKRLIFVFVITVSIILLFTYKNTINIDAYDVQYSISNKDIIKNSNIEDMLWKDYKLGKGIDNTHKPYTYWIKFKFNTDLNAFDDPAIALGKIGDIDETYFNGKFIGATGHIEGKSKSYYHQPRLYRVSKELIKKTNTVIIHAKKKSILRAGIHSGPVEFGEYEKLKSKTTYAYFLVFYLGVILGFFGLVMGFYHLYLYIRIPEKKENLYYFIFSLFSSLFIYSLSWGFTNHFENEFVVARLNCFLGVMTAVTYLLFIYRFLNKDFKAIEKIFIGIQLLFPVICLIPNDIDTVFKLYSVWFILGLGTIIYAGYLFIYYYYTENREDLRVLVGSILVMLLCAFFDVLHSLELFSSFQLSGIGFFALNIGIMFSLAQDFTTAYLNVEKTVEERTKDLSQALEHIKQIEDQKKKFFTNISHDLKTPISIAISRLDELNEFVSKKGQETAQKCENALIKLKSMVMDILDTISSEAGKINLIWSKDNAVEFIESWVSDFDSIAKQKNKSIHFSTNEDVINIPWDREKFSRVFDNLISNSLKYCPVNGDIFVRVITMNTRFKLEIEDTGNGLPKEEWKSVFKRFYQGSSTNLKDHGGSGIGLSFVYEVISKMNGNVFIEKGDIGKIKFVVELPLNQDIDLVESDSVESFELHSNTLKSYKVSEYPRKWPEKENPDLPKLLVAEDNPDIAEIVLHLLDKEYNLYFAENGNEAISILEKISIDCILSDLMMPEMDGSELLEQVRSDYRWKLIPFIMVTSKSDSDNIIHHLKSGAQDYITKPFEKDILKARVLSHSHTSILRKHMLNSDKLAALGVLAAGIAHEIKNPVHAANNFSTIVKKRINHLFENLSDRNEEFEGKMNFAIDKVIEHIKKISDLSSAIGSYSTGYKERVHINVNEMVDDSVLLFGAKLKESGIKVNKDYSKEKMDVLAYTSLNQSVVNILDNAIAVAKSSVIIRTKRTEHRISIQIEDDGEGIPPELQNKIFDRFMTTKPPGEGTGLGLSIVKDIVEMQHNGTIEILSSTPKGTIFEIKIPFEAPKLDSSGADVFHGKGETHAY